METIEFLSAYVLRLNLIAFVLLGACLWILRSIKQPVERIRIIQVCLAVLAITLTLGIADVLPKVEIPFLPLSQSTDWAEPDGLNVAQEMVARPGEVGRSGRSSKAAAFATSASDETSFVLAGPAIGGNVQSSPDQYAGRSPLLRRVFTVCFVGISLLNLAYLLGAFFVTRRLVYGSRPLDESALARVEKVVADFPACRSVGFLNSDLVDAPTLTGYWRPTILLPNRLTQSDVDLLELRHNLAHECAHIEQHDLLTWQLASFCQIFLWIQPCYWSLRRELRLAQDQLADQFAIEQTTERANYARTLMELSRSRQRVLPGALTMAGGKSNLYRRIEMLTNEKFSIVRVTRKSMLMLLGVVFAAAGGMLTSMQLTHAVSPVAEAPGGLYDDEAASENTDGENEGDVKSVEHSGVVVDAETGEPIAGVTVTVTRMESHDWQELAVTESKTDENGKYTFTIPPNQLAERLLYIMFDIDHPDYAQRHCGSYGYGMIVANLQNGEQPWFSKFKMIRGNKVSGRLVDKNQQPISGAAVRCSSDAVHEEDSPGISSWVKSVSDEDGRFEVLATHSGVAELSFIPVGHCMKYIDVGEKRGDLGDIVLADGFSVQGVVEDVEGNPLSDLWVNIAPEKDGYGTSYEMERSVRTDQNGKFVTRPLAAGKYLFEVQTKATGALEKLEYANFHDTPPPAMFVKRSIELTQKTASEPIVLKAVPHVMISLQHFKPDGEISLGHSPRITGEFDEKFVWIPKANRTGKGAFELMAPAGLEKVKLQFVTNEHSGLMVQFEGGKPTPKDTWRFDRLEKDIDNFRVVRYPAAILKLNIVDPSGDQLKSAEISPGYILDDDDAAEETNLREPIGWNWEDEMYRLSSLVPGQSIEVEVAAPGFQSQTLNYTMKERERKTVTIELVPEDDGDVTADGESN